MNNTAMFEDAFNLLCGNKIGQGEQREVFECSIRDDLVVKVENAHTRWFNNVLEMNFWYENHEFQNIAKWLAPCYKLSPDGRLLLQARCEPIGSRELPEKMPHFLTDFKKSNFGIYEGRIVCVDYAYVVNAPLTRMKKIEWRTG